jgi:N-acetylmuramoyl-L-alanine amidase
VSEAGARSRNPERQRRISNQKPQRGETGSLALKNLLSGRDLKRFGSSPCARTAAVLTCLLLPAMAQARVHRSQAWAETQFEKAENDRETLNGHAEQARTRREYQAVIASYRRIVLEAPTTSKADGSAFAVAELTAEMGRHFKDDLALYAAVREYKYLRREYPGSKHRIEALLAIGEIYKNDLGDDGEAQAAFEELLHRYPNSHYAAEARTELAGMTQLPSGEKHQPDAAASSANGDDDQHATVKQAASGQSPAKENSGDQIVRVTAVQHWSTPDYTRVTVELEQDVEFESQRIDNPDRIFFDLKNARLASDLIGKSLDVDDGLVKKVRIAQYKPGRARIVIETEDQASYNASLLLNPPRLIIDVHGENSRVDQSATAANGKLSSASTVRSSAAEDSPWTKVLPASAPTVATASTDTVPKKVVVEADDDDSSDADTSSPKITKKPVRASTPVRSLKNRVSSEKNMREAQPTSDGDRSLIRALGLKIGKIVIDPGHGGHDTGTIGPNGLLEKDLVLDVSKRLGKLLASRLGAEVVFTRRDDTFIPLETRTSIANQEQADLFVSVHANSSHNPDARGVETYYLNFTSSPEALEVAARENAASDKSIHELQDLVKKIALKEKIEESREFASDVQQSLHSGLSVKSAGIRDRGVKKAPFVVLIGANMPSILAEISFISNPGDEQRLRGPEYRQRIAESLCRGISRYVNGLGGVKVASKIEKASVQ